LGMPERERGWCDDKLVEWVFWVIRRWSREVVIFPIFNKFKEAMNERGLFDRWYKLLFFYPLNHEMSQLFNSIMHPLCVCVHAQSKTMQINDRHTDCFSLSYL
jgi:hypothetical protein